MKKLSIIVCCVAGLAAGGCNPNGASIAGAAINTAITLAASQSGGGYGGAVRGGGRSAYRYRRGMHGLPNTPQCRRYLALARVSGAPGTYGPLIKAYDACEASAERAGSRMARRLRCGKGKYYSWYNGQRRCL